MKLQDYTTPASEIVLPNDLLWVDEFDWPPVLVASEWTVSGALIIQKGLKLAGRNITLKSPDSSMGWADRAGLELLRTWYVNPAKKMRLFLEKTNDTRQFVVVFGAEPVKTTPVKGFADHEQDDPYTLEIRLIQAE